MVKQFSDKL